MAEVFKRQSYNHYDRLYDKAGKPHFTGHLPGYTGYCPGKRYHEGMTFGAATEKINSKIRAEIEASFTEPRGPRCTEVKRYSVCHSLPMTIYRQRPQSAAVFKDGQEMQRLMDSLKWYSESAKSRARLGINTGVRHRYKHRAYPGAPRGLNSAGDLEGRVSGGTSSCDLPISRGGPRSTATQSEGSFVQERSKAAVIARRQHSVRCR